jgi:hypothetical protein
MSTPIGAYNRLRLFSVNATPVAAVLAAIVGFYFLDRECLSIVQQRVKAFSEVLGLAR